jgi:hypothetical protein
MTLNERGIRLAARSNQVLQQTGFIADGSAREFQKKSIASTPVLFLSAIRVPKMNHTGKYQHRKLWGTDCTIGGSMARVQPIGQHPE